jgi:beta-mannanase
MSCILHLIISIRDGAKKKFREHYEEVADWFWWCYEAETKRGFAQRWKSFMRPAQESSWDEKIKGKLERANEKKLDSYKAYFYFVKIVI